MSEKWEAWGKKAYTNVEDGNTFVIATVHWLPAGKKPYLCERWVRMPWLDGESSEA